MAEAQRASLMYGDVVGFGSGSKSLKGRGRDRFPLQLRTLSPQTITSGGSLSWWLLKRYGILWGSAVELRYPQLEPGYTYVWDLNERRFIVTTDTGEVISHNDITTVKGLGIVWKILKSDQFSVLFSDLSNRDVFLIAARQERADAGYRPLAAGRMHNDFLADGEQHAVFGRLSVYGDSGGEYDGAQPVVIIDDFLSEEIVRSILLSKAEGLQATNAFPLDLIAGINNLDSERPEQMRQGQLAMEIHFLMIALFAQNLLSAHPKVLFEPWMLWSAFQWYVKIIRSSANQRRIFDLSPRWG